MTEVSPVKFTTNAQVGEIQINREHALNAINREVLESLSSIFEGVERSFKHRHTSGLYANTRVLILRGVGDKAFVAGADIKFMQHSSPTELRRFIELGEYVMRQAELLPVPIIAAVDGFAIGGGMELALACDLIVATERAKFGQAEVNLGIIPGFGGTQRLIRRTGVGTAKRLIFTGENVGGEEAHRLGIADYFVPRSELDSTIKKLTDTLLLRGPLAIAAAKKAIEAGESGGKVYGLEAEKEGFLEVFDTKDAAEGVKAFLERRKAEFRGE